MADNCIGTIVSAFYFNLRYVLFFFFDSSWDFFYVYLVWLWFFGTILIVGMLYSIGFTLKSTNCHKLCTFLIVLSERKKNWHLVRVWIDTADQSASRNILTHISLFQCIVRIFSRKEFLLGLVGIYCTSFDY